jgi:hypothetical protein
MQGAATVKICYYQYGLAATYSIVTIAIAHLD